MLSCLSRGHGTPGTCLNHPQPVRIKPRPVLGFCTSERDFMRKMNTYEFQRVLRLRFKVCKIFLEVTGIRQ